MTNPVRICRQNDSDDPAIVSASSAFSSLPSGNVKDDDIQKVWRATTTTAHLTIDTGISSTLGVAALINTSLRLTDATRVRASLIDSSVLTSLTYDSGDMESGVDPKWRKFVHFPPIDTPYRYVRFDFTQVDLPQVGRAVVGPVWAPTRDMSFGWERLWRDLSVRERSLGGNEFVDIRPRQRGYRFRIIGLTEEEAEDQVDELNRLRGIGRDVLICRNKDSNNLGRDTIWGLMEEPARAVHSFKSGSGGQFYEVNFEVYERV
jgi:hypothetical protein